MFEELTWEQMQSMDTADLVGCEEVVMKAVIEAQAERYRIMNRILWLQSEYRRLSKSNSEGS